MTTKTARRDTIAKSPAVQKQHAARRIDVPISLTGISEGKLLKVTVAMYRTIDIDPTYQRGEQKGEINELIVAIQNGGLIPDPVTLVRRNYGPDGERKKLWVVDGQQRVAAFQNLDREFMALVYEADTYEAEKNFFLVMNDRKDVSANNIIHAWPGPGATMMRTVDADPMHPLHGRILFRPGSGDSIRAMILARGMVIVATGGRGSAAGAARSILNRIDHALKTDPQAKERCRLFLRLVAGVFPKYAAALPMQALAIVAHRRWTSGAGMDLPTDKTLYNITRINWNAIVPSQAARFSPILEAEIDRRWR